MLIVFFFKAIGYHFELFTGMIFAEKSAAITKQHWPHVLKSVRDPFDCRASRCTRKFPNLGMVQNHIVRYFEGMNIHSPAILLGSPWDPMGFDPQPSGCVMLFMFRYPAKNYHWYPATASTFLGGWLGLKTWIQPRHGCWTVPVWRLSRLDQVEHDPSLPQMYRFQVTPCLNDGLWKRTVMGLIIFHPHPTRSITIIIGIYSYT